LTDIPPARIIATFHTETPAQRRPGERRVVTRSLAVAPLRIVALGVVAFALLVSGGTPAYAWSYPAPLNTNAPFDSSAMDEHPEVTTDGEGKWVAVWHSNSNLSGGTQADRDILVSLSADKGATWTAPAALNTNALSDSGDDFWPQVTTDGAGNWVAVWSSAEQNLNGGIGTDRDILAARSTDDGDTWTDPVVVNTNAATDSGDDIYPQLATYGAGNWLAVWASNEANLSGGIGADYDILVSASTTSLTWPWTWTDPVAFNANAVSDSGDDHHPEVTTDGGGNCVAVWDSLSDLSGGVQADRDILVSTSSDTCATWSSPAFIDPNAPVDSLHDTVPQVETDGGGNWVAVWHGNEPTGGTPRRDIVVARSTNNGANWTPPAFLDPNVTPDAGSNRNPRLAIDRWGHWVTVWWSDEDLFDPNLGASIGTDDDILVSRSSNDGISWTASVALNTNGASDTGDDRLPQVTTSVTGAWVAVWLSYENLGGTLGTDSDILYATEYTPPYPPVGGIAELPQVSDSSGPNYIALAGLAAAALVALTAGARYARRRWLG
jgi:hypothetical protein